MEFNDVLNRRYSCRAFAARSVQQEKVERILEAGRIVPTAVNKQPVRTLPMHGEKKTVGELVTNNE